MQLAEPGTENILIVEDEQLIAVDVQEKLHRLGYPVPAIAQSGAEALLCARSTPFDLVLIDIRLRGGMDGIATAQALKTEFDTPVVFMTAHTDQETINRAKLAEPLGYVVKPVSDDDLRSTVRSSLHRHHMERRVRTSEAWLSATLDSVGDGIVAADSTGEIVFMNPVAEKLTGWRGVDAQGRMLMEILTLFEESGGRSARNPVWELVPGESRGYQLVPRHGGETVVEVRCFENRSPATSLWRIPPMPPGASQASPRPGSFADKLAAGVPNDRLGIVVVLRDVTTRRQLEKRLVQAQRMETVANMAGGLAHDSNNQRTVIPGYAADLCKRMGGENREAALEIGEAASVAASITSQLLVPSRRSEVRFEVLNVDEVVAEMQPILSRSIDKIRTVTTDLNSSAGPVRCDRNQLKQVLLNLALNARDAMPTGGTLRIQTAIREIEPESQGARIYHPGRYVRIRVTDGGSGMDKALPGGIFEPLFSTAKTGLGTGMGLSVVHSIIVQSGGYLVAECEIGRGTTFQVLLPCVASSRQTSEVAAEKRSCGEGPAPTILLVEDDDSVRRMMRHLLEREGYRMLEAENAQRAVEVAGAYEGAIHVLVTDVLMPGMTGLDLAAKLLHLRPDLKILFVSGYPHDSLQRLGLSKGELNLLPKPFPVSELLRRVQMLVPRPALQ